MIIDIKYFNIYNYLSGRKKIKYNEIYKYNGATYDLELDTIWTNYKKNCYLCIKNINIISLFIPYKKMILYDNKIKNVKIIDEIFIRLNNICNSKIVCTFNIGFWKSMTDNIIIKDIILKLTHENENINKNEIKKYIKIAQEIKILFKEESICLEINDSLFII